ATAGSERPAGEASEPSAPTAAAGMEPPAEPPAEPASGSPGPAPVSARNILRPVAGLALLDVVAGFLWGGLSVALVIFAVDRLGAGEEATGFLWAAVGVGGGLGGRRSH